MWPLTSLVTGLPDIPSTSLGVFRFALGLAVVWKTLWEHHWGGASYFNEDSLTRWRYERRVRFRKLVPTPTAYRVFYYTRMVCALLLLAGFLSQIALIVLALWYFFEFSFDRKFHTAFLGLCCTFLTLSSDTENYLSVGRLLIASSLTDFFAPGVAAQATADPWPQVLLTLLVVHLYWSSAWHKLRSPQFLSGDALQKALEHYALIRKDVRHSEIWYPNRLTRVLTVDEPDAVRRRWRLPSQATVAVEALIPVLLLIPATWGIACVAGILLHIAFTGILPRRLLPFTIATVATYPLFLDPVVVTAWLTGLTG